MKKMKKRIIFAALILVLLVPIGVYAGFMLYFYFSLKSGMSPEYWAEYDTFVGKRWTFEPEELFPEPFAPETIEAAREFQRLRAENHNQILMLFEWESVRAGRSDTVREYDAPATSSTASVFFEKTRPVDPSEIPSLDEMLERAERLRPVLEAWARMAAMPDYNVELLSVAKMHEDGIRISTRELFNALSVLYLAKQHAEYLVEKDRHVEAMEILESTSRGIRLHPRASCITVLAYSSGVIVMAGVWEKAIQEIDNPEILRRTLSYIDQIPKSEDYATTGATTIVNEILTDVRVASRLGLRMDPNGLTAHQMIMEFHPALEIAYFNQIVLPKVDESKRAEVEERVANTRVLREPLRLDPRHFFIDLARRHLTRRVVFSMLVREDLDRNLSKCTESLDRLRAATIARIAELEKKDAPMKPESKNSEAPTRLAD
jgi:hypothetical protein